MDQSSQLVAEQNPYTFSLRAISANKRGPPDTDYDFSPLLCRKTYKLIRLTPTYHHESQISFQSEADPLTRSLTMIPETTKTSAGILIPRPTTKFCQICKQSFEDYIKHILHPIHKKKQVQSDESLDFDSLKDSLEKKQRKPRKLTWFNQKDDQIQMQNECCSQTSFSRQVSLRGSKKRIILNEDGQLQPISLASSTECFQKEDDGPIIERRANRKFSNFKALSINE